jgi:hypothetical protein
MYVYVYIHYEACYNGWELPMVGTSRFSFSNFS